MFTINFKINEQLSMIIDVVVQADEKIFRSYRKEIQPAIVRVVPRSTSLLSLLSSPLPEKSTNDIAPSTMPRVTRIPILYYLFNYLTPCLQTHFSNVLETYCCMGFVCQTNI